MSTSRGPTPVEEQFNSAFSIMRNIDRLLWYMDSLDSSPFKTDEDRVLWAKREILEDIKLAKIHLDHTTEAIKAAQSAEAKILQAKQEQQIRNTTGA